MWETNNVKQQLNQNGLIKNSYKVIYVVAQQTTNFNLQTTIDRL
jgi:hypothetical protein